VYVHESNSVGSLRVGLTLNATAASSPASEASFNCCPDMQKKSHNFGVLLKAEAFIRKSFLRALFDLAGQGHLVTTASGRQRFSVAGNCLEIA
jgi:hypothetical protein